MLQVSKWDNVSILQSSLRLSVRQLSSTPNQKYVFFLLPVVLFVNLECFSLSYIVSEISAVCLPSLQYNGARRHSARGAKKG